MLSRQSAHFTKILCFARSGSMQVSTMENEVLYKCQEATRKKYNVLNRLITGVYEDDLLKVNENFTTSPRLCEAIELLNSFVSNKAVIEKASKQAPRRSHNIEITNTYLKMLDIDLDKLSNKVIHVTGTKGKGSTCALTESIVRAYGFTTGFFSSPHLFSVTERIRINGQPISEQTFSYYFWKIYNKLLANKGDEDLPSYFKFLTLLAFHIFIEENVDVAIIEVGIGGEFDCTNVLRNTPVVGITSLGYDHTNILGNKIENIAWAKAGIMKEGSIGFTCLDQPPEAMTVLYERAEEKKCKLFKVSRHIEGLNEVNPAVYLNASLAIRLAHAWMYLTKGMKLLFRSDNFSWDDDIIVPEKTIESIRKCIWPGRFHILKKGNITYYLDGAHTSESIDYCSKWFSNNISRDDGKRILVFNLTGDRNPAPLLQLLIPCSFDEVYFCPNVLAKSLNIPNDIVCKVSPSMSNEVCCNNKRIWKDIGGGKTLITESILETLEKINNETSNVNVLVTGSLHLVGNSLNILQPDLWS